MKQMKVPAEQLVELDYEASDCPALVRELQPAIFRDGNGYRCLLGPDVQTAIIGSGDTVDQAIANWELALRERMQDADEGDEVAQYALDMLQASNRKVW